MKQEEQKNKYFLIKMAICDVKCQNLADTLKCTLSVFSFIQDNLIIVYFSGMHFFQPYLFLATFFHPPACNYRRLGQSDWGQSVRWVGRVRGCLPQRSASVIRTAQGWRDNRQNTVLFKDGSPLFLKCWRGPRRRRGSDPTSTQSKSKFKGPA